MNRIFSLILCVCFVLCCVLCPAYAQDGVPSEVMDAAESVVRIQADYSDGYATGSGFVVKSDKSGTVIVTNAHVVADVPKSIKVWLNDTESVSARILAISNQQDLCILELSSPVQYLKTLVLSAEDAARGEAVYAVGFPAAADILSNTDAKGSDAATITNGIVSAVRQMSAVDYGPVMTILQINAAINSGNSGGPLFNSKGIVVGVNTYKAGESEGIFGSIAVSELLNYLSANNISVSLDSKTASTNPWFFVAVGVAVAVVIVVAIVVKKKKKNANASPKVESVTLREFMARRAEPLSDEETVSLLMPVVLELRKLHSDGRCHLEISPDSVIVNRQSVTLNPPTGQESARYCSGFAAPEIYSGANCGIGADIYSVCGLLSFLRQGTSPENALKRSDAEITTEGLPSVITKGMALDATQRFSTMQDLIYALAPYNTGVVPQLHIDAPAEEQLPMQKKKEHKKISGKLIATVAAFVAVLAVGSMSLWVFLQYKSALAFAQAGEFKQAKETLVMPAVVSLIDRPLNDYLQAGTLLEERQYSAAQESFDALGEYRDSELLATSAQYYYASQLADSLEFEKAIDIFSGLATKNYLDSAYRVQETTYLWALKNIQDKHYTIAKQQLKSLDSFRDSRELLIQLTDMIYLEGIKLYQSGNMIKASEYFSLLSEYERSEDYLFLIKAHQHSYCNEDNYNKMTSMIGFADTGELLLNIDFWREMFLTGTWESADGYTYFNLKTDGHISYNLPHSSYGDYYRIEDGDILFYPEGEYYNTHLIFSMTVINADCVDFYCWKDGSTYRLYRQ